MRHSLARGRLVAAYLLGFFCAFSAFSQGEINESAGEPRFELNRRPFPASIYFDSEAGTFRFDSNLPLLNSRRGKRRTGTLPLVSTASGITQIGDASVDARRGLFSSNGQRTTSNLVVSDGVPANLGLIADDSSIAAGLGAIPTLTASGGTQNLAAAAQSSELVVRTMAGADEQRVAGAQLMLTSRGGNNRYRGNLFETFGNEALNANDAFAQAAGFGRAPARLNEFGGSLGGYIIDDRMWFYTGYDGLRLRQPAFAVTEVPDAASRQTASPAMRAILAAFPVANGRPTSSGAATFASNFVNPAAHDIFGVRLDFSPTYKVRAGGRYTLTDSSASVRGDRETVLSNITTLANRSDLLNFWTTATPTSSVVVEGRAGFSRHRLARELSSDNFGGAAPLIPNGAADFRRFDFTGRGASIVAGDRIASAVNQFFATFNATAIAGPHTLRFGAEFRRLSLDVGAARIDRNVLFGGFSSANGNAARVAELRRTVTATPETTDFSFYASNNVRLRPTVSLSFGLRNDSERAVGPVLAEFASGTFSPQMPRRLLNLAPRVGGVASFFTGRTTVRAGAGLFYDFASPTASEAFANSLPFASGATSFGIAPDAAPTSPLRPLIAFDRNFETPRAWHLFTEVQQRLTSNSWISALYTASLGRHLRRTRTTVGTDTRFTYLRLSTSDGESDLDSLQIRYERRLTSSFSVNARYSLQQSRDDFSPDSLRETNRTQADSAADRGASDFDVRHQFSLYGVYELPALFEAGWKKAVTDDWSLFARLSSRSALPVKVGYYRVDEFGREFVRADAVAGTPFYFGKGDSRTLNRAAFSVPAASGNLERNSVRGFGMAQVDASLKRRFRITNEMRIDLSMNVNNVFNSTNFADMSGILGTRLPNGDFRSDPYFGRAVTTNGSNGFTPFYLYGGPRSIEFALKFVF